MTEASVKEEDHQVTVNIRSWLKERHPKQLMILERFERELATDHVTTAAQASSLSPSDRRLAKALKTIELLKVMIGSTRWKTPAQLVALLKALGRELDSAGGRREPVVGNAVRRIIAAVREEVMTGTTVTSTTDLSSSNSNANARLDPFESILWALPQQVKTTGRAGSTLPSSSSDQPRHHASARTGSIGSVSDAWVESSNLSPVFFEPSRPDLKQSIMEAIQELTADVEDVYKNICQQAPNHIHSGEIILTYGKSHTVEEFLKAAAGVDGSKSGGVTKGSHGGGSANPKLRFSVIVVDSGEDGAGGGQDLAPSLATLGIDTCIVPVSSVCAIMARVNKVVLPAHSVLANGGLVAPSGSNLVVLAAKANAVPVVVLTGIFKLTPVFPHEQQNTLNDLLSPSSVMNYVAYQQGPDNSHPDNSHQAALMTGRGSLPVDLVNPLHDYVQPQLINLYVTNVGSFQPSYIYRLLAEYYHSDDWGAF